MDPTGLDDLGSGGLDFGGGLDFDGGLGGLDVSLYSYSFDSFGGFSADFGLAQSPGSFNSYLNGSTTGIEDFGNSALYGHDFGGLPGFTGSGLPGSGGMAGGDGIGSINVGGVMMAPGDSVATLQQAQLNRALQAPMWPQGSEEGAVPLPFLAAFTGPAAVPLLIGFAAANAIHSTGNFVRNPGLGTGAGVALATLPFLGIPDAAAAPEGSFSIVDWSGYPANLPKPTGPFRLLEGAEYDAARAAANQANRVIHGADSALDGLQVHEIQPVKFGGSPTDPLSKIALTPQQHATVTTWWNQLQRDIEGR